MTPPEADPTRSSVPSQGIRGWSQLIHASLLPSGDGVGNAKNCAPLTRILIAPAAPLSARAASPAVRSMAGWPAAGWSAGWSAALPSSGTATIARFTFMPPPTWNPVSGRPSSGRDVSRTHQISRPSGEMTRSANRNPAPSGVSGAGSAASSAPAPRSR